MLTKADKVTVLSMWDGGDLEQLSDFVSERVDSHALAQALALALQGLGDGYGVLSPRLRELADNEDLWHEAGNEFIRLRAETLLLEQAGESNTPAGALLLLQENIAKTLCNASSNPRQFDADSGKWAILCLGYVLQAAPSSISEPVKDAFIRHLSAS